MDREKVRSNIKSLHADIASRATNDGPPDEEMLRRAADAISVLGETFEKHAIAEVEKMYRLFREGSDVESLRQENAHNILQLARDLRLQGAKFEYPLVTRISASLATFIAARQKSGELDRDDFEVICVHLDALNALLALRVIHDGGSTGEEIGNGFDDAVEQLLPGR